jgi:hypothetical protein
VKEPDNDKHAGLIQLGFSGCYIKPYFCFEAINKGIPSLLIENHLAERHLIDRHLTERHLANLIFDRHN